MSYFLTTVIVLFCIKYFYDKKKIKILQKQKDELHFQMQVQEKMLFLQSRQASLGELVGNVSHQWKEPLGGLGAILSNLQATLLLQGEIKSDKLNDSIEKSHSILSHLSDTIAIFYRFYTTQKSDKREFNIYEEISNIALIVNYSLKIEGITLKFHCDNEIVGYGDRGEFVNAILNIILNAKDILIERKIKNPSIKVKVWEDDDNIIITIEDNGGGISQEPIEKIFEYAVSSKEDSTGIGLFIVKSIIKNRMKGHIQVQNNALGALFTITLPQTSNILDTTPTLTYKVQESAYDKIARLEKELAKQSEVEKALRQWQDIFEQTHWGVAVHKGTNSQFDMVNPAFCKMYGYTTKELQNMTIPDIIAPEYLEFWALKQKEAFEKSFISFESVNIKKGGIRFPVNVDLTVIKNEYDDILYSIANVRDITELKKANQELLFKDFAMETIDEAIFLIDEIGKFRYVNQGACKALGYTKEELLLLDVGDVDPDWPIHRWSEHWDLLKQQKTMRMELRHKRKDGSIFPVEVVANYIKYGDIDYNMALVRDISERKAAEESLLFKEFALNKISEAVFLIDKNANFQYVNESACKSLGYTEEELLSMKVSDIDSSISLEKFEAKWQKLTEIKTVSFETQHTKKDGTVFPVEINSNYFEYQNLAYNLATVRNISEKKEREEKFSKLFMSSPTAVL